MNAAISVLEVLNSEEELVQFPVEGTVHLRVSAPPDMYDINNMVYIIRHDGDQDTTLSRYADTSLNTLGSVNIDRYDTIEANVVSIEEEGSWVLEISSTEALIPNAEYYLVISKDLAPLHYEVSKLESYGGSNVHVETDQLAVGDTASYIIDVVTQSSLSTGSHIVGLNILKGGLQYEAIDLNIYSDSYEVSPGVRLVFDRDIPLMVGERFSATFTEFARIGRTLVQELKTFLVSDVIAPSLDIQSTRLNEADVLQFYEAAEWGKDVSATKDPITGYSYVLEYPNIIRIETKQEIDPSTLTTQSFSIKLSEAFDNYLLSSMGLYADKHYAVKFSIEDLTVIVLTIEVDTTNSIPGYHMVRDI